MTSQMVTQILGTDKVSTIQELWYADKGLGDLLPLPTGKKFHPPAGFTGAEGRKPNELDYANFDAQYQSPNFALRLAENVLVLDIDQHEKNGEAVDGYANLIEWQDENDCELEVLYCMTRGNPDNEGHIFFRYPGGNTRGQLCPGVDVLRRGHRYSVCWPSVVDGRQYRWYRWVGRWVEITEPPHIDDLPEAPEKLVQFLTTNATRPIRRADRQTTGSFRGDIEADNRPMSRVVNNALKSAVKQFEAAVQSGSSRHDAMLSATFRIVMLCAKGYPDFSEAEKTLRAEWDKCKDKPSSEFTRMLDDAFQKAANEFNGEYKHVASYELIDGSRSDRNGQSLQTLVPASVIN